MDGSNIEIPCECGCGVRFLKYDDRHRERRFIIGHNRPVVRKIAQQICKVCGIEYERSLSHSNRGKNTYCSNQCRAKDTASWNSGELNKNWKGGISGVASLRWAPEYRIWQKTVFQRDRFLCIICESPNTHKNPLHAHHIVPWSIAEELRFEISNGMTIHKECHQLLHKLIRGLHNGRQDSKRERSGKRKDEGTARASH